MGRKFGHPLPHLFLLSSSLNSYRPVWKADEWRKDSARRRDGRAGGAKRGWPTGGSARASRPMFHSLLQCRLIKPLAKDAREFSERLQLASLARYNVKTCRLWNDEFVKTGDVCRRLSLNLPLTVFPSVCMLHFPFLKSKLSTSGAAPQLLRMCYFPKHLLKLTFFLNTYLFIEASLSHLPYNVWEYEYSNRQSKECGHVA